MSREQDRPTNRSTTPDLLEIAATAPSRRDALRGALAAVGGLVARGGGAGAFLAACGDDYRPSLPGRPTSLGFAAVPRSLEDRVTVPRGYSAHVVVATGDPLAGGVGAYANDGSDDADSFAARVGDHHDGMAFFPLGERKDRGLLCVNHESCSPLFAHPRGGTVDAEGRRPAEEVLREMYLYGVSVIELAREASGAWRYVQDSSYNRRVHALTEVELCGPLRGHPAMITRFSPDGTRTRGTIQNCASGATPWGTYLTCEENWAGQFRRLDDDPGRSDKELADFARYGVGGAGRFIWSTPSPDTADDVFGRWELRARGAGAADDYRNAANTFGYVVEIDPYAPTAAPRKRTALGRFAHESATAAPAVAGKPVVFYSGDDARGEYLYKYVSRKLWDPADASAHDRLAVGDSYLDDGTLYVAKFFADGTGAWLELSLGKNGIDPSYQPFAFASAAEVWLHTRLAADAAGATRLDRPEWVAVDPLTGAGYATLTNSVGVRALGELDAVNPRYYNDPRTDGGVVTAQWGNPNGHIVRWQESSPEATDFTWDLYLFGAAADAAEAVNLSHLDSSNELSSPDGLWFSPTTAICWIETDDLAATDESNCMLLAALPGEVGDGRRLAVDNRDERGERRRVVTRVGAAPGHRLRRFLVGPVGCEITGLAESPDGTALFVNIQHPGEGSPSLEAAISTWPAGVPGARPRSATLVITRDDGGPIGT